MFMPNSRTYRTPWLGCLALGAFLVSGAHAADDVLPPASQRFAAADVQDEPSFQRHVLPLIGRLGCNGRACHGSFQGQGGFRLSLFGYDFQADHQALTAGEKPRVDLKNPLVSLLLTKPASADEHEGGKRFSKGSWQYHVLRRWVETGGKNDGLAVGKLVKLEVTPAEIQFRKVGETQQLRAVAEWSDGFREDVTPLCRFQSNDGSLAEVTEEGQVKCAGRGDTHVVVFYDNGITPVPVMLPVSQELAAKYPRVPTPTKIDELVVAKLQKIGVVPSEVATDEEFLRRVSLDMTGSLPTAEEVQAFVAESATDKRARKIDELLERPAYAAWWTTRLCDITGNNSQFLPSQSFRDLESRQWYDWLNYRVAKNVPYDDLVAGIVLATSRKPGQSYEEYCREAASFYRSKERANFAEEGTLTHYWSRRNVRTIEEKSLSFAYAFLGVRLQCAQCHKHPFDQWSKHDFDQFTAFFNGITFGNRAEDKEAANKMKAQLGLDNKKLSGTELRKVYTDKVDSGSLVPFEELYVNAKAPRRRTQEVGSADPDAKPKLLGGNEVSLAEYPDPRVALMNWLKREDNPYFARAFVNRVWANYFHAGIVEPADDMNQANPPSNAPLLDYLTREFIAHKYDMKWLHRTIANSHTYQRSWRTNETNQHDLKNFSRAVPRRMPAEVALDAIYLATAGAGETKEMCASVDLRAIGPASSAINSGRSRGSSYALQAFGKPARTTNCDCERSLEPSLLQTLYLRNDNEMLAAIERTSGWLTEVGKQVKKGTEGEAKVIEGEGPRLITLAYLRTLSRQPTDQEVNRALEYFREAKSLTAGLRDLVWALLNTKEFIVNH